MTCQFLCAIFRCNTSSNNLEHASNDLSVLVRDAWSAIKPVSHQIEHGFSDGDGKTWEATFVALLERDIP